MEINNFNSKSIDELWNIYEELTDVLSCRVAAEKARLDERLRKIGRANDMPTEGRVRRPYPKVYPKYQNAKNPAETWSGRGKQPLWVKAQLRAGKKLKDLVIGQ